MGAPDRAPRRTTLAAGAQSPAPLILTLKMDDGSQERFDRLRKAYFPPERNYLSAHLTLFHHLPADREGEVVGEIEEVRRRQGRISLRASGLLFMGRGVAYKLESPELVALRRRLASGWEPFLTNQDRQGLRPHVTVQNKVQPEKARALHRLLESSFSPFEVLGEGLLLWRYLGGPWEEVGDYPFRG
jgi:2'-5' RNA ligase